MSAAVIRRLALNDIILRGRVAHLRLRLAYERMRANYWRARWREERVR